MRSSALTAAAAVLVAHSLLLANGAFHPLALAGVTLAIVAGAGALFLAGPRPEAPDRPAGRRWVLAILWVGLASSLAVDALVPPGIYADPSRLPPWRGPLAVLAALVATHAWRVSPRIARVRFAAELGSFLLLAALVVRSSPVPWIDVWVIEKLGATALLDGVNPYSVGYPNIYGPATTLIADALLTPDRTYVVANPYTPLTLLLVTPAVALAADPRWTMVAAALFGAWAVRRLGRGSDEANLAAVLVLVQPRGLFVLEQSWTEPLVLALVLGAALAVSRLRDGAAPGAPPPAAAFGARDLALVAVAGAGAVAIKQYTPLLLAPLVLAMPRGTRLRSMALAAAGAVAIAVPFVLWDPQGFLRGVVLFQMEQPFRPDALSWPAALFRLTGTQAPAWIAFAAAAAVVVWVARGRVTVARALLGGALAWLVFVVLSKQAFCNYYWLAVGLLCAAVAAASRPGGEGSARADEA
jgi:hypothetical protein